MPQPECPHCGGDRFMKNEARVAIVRRYVRAVDEHGVPVDLQEVDPEEVEQADLVPGEDIDVPMKDLVGGPLFRCMGCGRRYDTVPVAED